MGYDFISMVRVHLIKTHPFIYDMRSSIFLFSQGYVINFHKIQLRGKFCTCLRTFIVFTRDVHLNGLSFGLKNI